MISEPSETDLKALRKWVSNKVYLYVNDDGASREEITQSVISDYWKYTKENNVYPIEYTYSRNHEAILPASARALANSILKRRVSDHYRRKAAKSVLQLTSPHEIDNTYMSSAPSHYRQILHESILIELIQWITKQSRADRDLLLRDISTKSIDSALTPLERKRLSRLRQKAKDKLMKKFGESLKDLLSD